MEDGNIQEGLDYAKFVAGGAGLMDQKVPSR